MVLGYLGSPALAGGAELWLAGSIQKRQNLGWGLADPPTNLGMRLCVREIWNQESPGLCLTGRCLGGPKPRNYILEILEILEFQTPRAEPGPPTTDKPLPASFSPP